MKTMKQWFLLAVTAVLCAAMAACADTGASSSAAASSAPASSAPASSAVSESTSAPASSSEAASESGDAVTAEDPYTAAIVASRDQETNDSLPVLGAKAGESAVYTYLPSSMENDPEAAAQMADMVMQTLTLTPDQLQQYAFSISLINVKAYGVGVFMPAEGQTEAVKAALEDFVVNQQKSFENYLADQYEIAKQAKVEVLPTGEVVLVMCENSSEAFSTIEAALQ